MGNYYFFPLFLLLLSFNLIYRVKFIKLFSLCHILIPAQARSFFLYHIIFLSPLYSLVPPLICLILQSNFSFTQGFSRSILVPFWARQIFVVGAVLCIIGCLMTSLTSPPSIVTTKNVSGYCRMSPVIGSAKSPLVENNDLSHWEVFSSVTM